MKIKYVGPDSAVFIPDVPGVFERDKPVDVPDSLGEELMKLPVFASAEKAAEKIVEEKKVSRSKLAVASVKRKK